MCVPKSTFGMAKLLIMRNLSMTKPVKYAYSLFMMCFNIV